jgi:hypothetical protein
METHTEVGPILDLLRMDPEQVLMITSSNPQVMDVDLTMSKETWMALVS